MWCVPPPHRCFDGFGNWVQVTQATTSALLRKVPADPGLYEWAAMAPDDGPLMAFYLGKASEWQQRNNVC